jgi:hypothetical protein
VNVADNRLERINQNERQNGLGRAKNELNRSGREEQTEKSVWGGQRAWAIEPEAHLDLFTKHIRKTSKCSMKRTQTAERSKRIQAIH